MTESQILDNKSESTSQCGYSDALKSRRDFSEDTCLSGIVNKHVRYDESIDKLHSGFYNKSDPEMLNYRRFWVINTESVISMIEWKDISRWFKYETSNGSGVDWAMNACEAADMGNLNLIKYCVRKTPKTVMRKMKRDVYFEQVMFAACEGTEYKRAIKDPKKIIEIIDYCISNGAVVSNWVLRSCNNPTVFRHLLKRSREHV
jgi:hypothetical protein